MKSIGPYVAARELPGRPSSPVRTLRATDRLTGMPVLLHVLPGHLLGPSQSPGALPDLPAHPHLLPLTDSGADGELAYTVTELPLQARPASDAVLTARGALAALNALHTRGLVHGGLSSAQLWSVDGQVLLAGAGLPWGGDARPADDLYALAVILEDLGGLPGSLRPLATQPGTLNAAQALAALNAADGGPANAAPAAGDVSVKPAAPPAPTAEAAAPTAPTAGASAHDGTPIVLGDPPAAAPDPAPVPVSAPAVSVATPPPTGPETPQERRRRQNEERRAQAMLDAQAAAARKAEQLRADQSRAGQTAAPQPPAPIQIGFADDLPTWAPAETQTAAPRTVPTEPVERLPASLRRPAQDPAPEPVAKEPAPAATHLPRRLPREPIRIGWDEDDSWRVVREAPAQGRTRPAMPEWAKPEWFGPRRAVAVLGALLVVGGGWWALTQRPEELTPPAPALVTCCTVRVTVQGAAGVTARLSLQEAPANANLTPGQDMGRAPGTLRLPVPGTYRLRVVAQGWTPATLTVRVPRTQPVTIDLSD